MHIYRYNGGRNIGGPCCLYCHLRVLQSVLEASSCVCCQNCSRCLRCPLNLSVFPSIPRSQRRMGSQRTLGMGQSYQRPNTNWHSKSQWANSQNYQLVTKLPQNILETNRIHESLWTIINLFTVLTEKGSKTQTDLQEESISPWHQFNMNWIIQDPFLHRKSKSMCRLLHVWKSKKPERPNVAMADIKSEMAPVSMVTAWILKSPQTKLDRGNTIPSQGLPLPASARYLLMCWAAGKLARQLTSPWCSTCGPYS